MELDGLIQLKNMLYKKLKHPKEGRIARNLLYDVLGAIENKRREMLHNMVTVA